MIGAEYLEQLQERSFRAASDVTRGAYPASSRLSGTQLADYLGRRKYLALATTRPDGRPHISMSSFVVARRSFWLPTEIGTARARNLETNPYASLVVTEGEEGSHVAVLAEGPAELLDVERATEGGGAWRAKFGHDPDWVGVWIRIEPRKLFSYAAPEALEGRVRVFRCRKCGDTFPAHEGHTVACPSCGGSIVDVAAEPLL